MHGCLGGAAPAFVVLVLTTIALNACGRGISSAPPRYCPCLYVVNQAQNFVAVYPASAKGNVEPAQIIAGGDTGLGTPLGVAIDPAGRIYVVNGGTSGKYLTPETVTVYSPDANGNSQPIRTIGGAKTGLWMASGGIAIDAAGSIYVANLRWPGREFIINVYASGSNGDAAPTRTIVGPSMGAAPGSLAVDHRGELYVLDRNAGFSGRISVYPPNASGDVKPIRSIEGPKTGLNQPRSIAVDKNGKVYVANEGTGTGNTYIEKMGTLIVTTIGPVEFVGTVTVYAPGSKGNASPTATIEGGRSLLLSTVGIALGAGGEIYVESDRGRVNVFAAGATGNVRPIRSMTSESYRRGRVNVITVRTAVRATGNVRSIRSMTSKRGLSGSSGLAIH